jgi:hypothetical protein
MLSLEIYKKMASVPRKSNLMGEQINGKLQCYSTGTITGRLRSCMVELLRYHEEEEGEGQCDGGSYGRLHKGDDILDGSVKIRDYQRRK